MRIIASVLLIFMLACAGEKKPQEKPPIRIQQPTQTKPRVDDQCMQRCMTRNAMRSVGAEQIEYDCELDCRVR